ncbi:T9SS type A sorting domain-containing protein [bacterium]|nr:T9SS type A sorting domain-containing protein [bacterium]
MKTKQYRASLRLLALSFVLSGPSAIMAQTNAWVKLSFSDYTRNLVIDKNNYVYAVGTGLYRSVDSGNTWSAIGNGLPQNFTAFGVHPNGNLFAAASSQVFRSSDNGASWTSCFNSSNPVSGIAFTPADEIYIINGNGGTYRSADNGDTWLQVPNGYSNRALGLTAIDINFGIIAIADTLWGIWEFFEWGDRWYLVNGGMINKDMVALLVTPTRKILAGTRAHGIYSLPLNSYSVYNSNSGLKSWGITDLALVSNGDIFACSNESGVYRSVDDGKTWVQINRGLSTLNISTIAVDHNYRLFAGTRYDGMYRRLELNTVAPAPPRLLSPVNNAFIRTTSTRLQWQQEDQADAYRLQVAHDTTSNQFLVDQSDAKNGYYDLTDLAFERDYYWRVEASNPEGSYWSGWWKFTLTEATTNNPLPLWPPNGATGIITPPTMHWNKVATATSYAIIVATSPAPIGGDSWVINRGGFADTLFQAEGLYSDRTYYWWVSARLPNNSIKLLSLPWKFTTGSPEASSSWTMQASGTQQPLNAIDFINQNEGWVVGDSGIVLHTSDGGASWSRQNSKTTTRLRSVDFVNTRIGYAVVQNGTFLRTVDGGREWRKSAVNGASPLVSVSFVNEDTGMVANYGAVYQTFDGGSTWEQHNVSVRSLSSLQYVNSQNAWAAGRVYVPCRDCDYSKILYTIDGGKSWVSAESKYFAIISSVFSVNASQAWYVTESVRIQSNFGSPGSGSIMATTDGGVTWQPQLVKSGITFKAIYFTSPQIGTAVGNAGVIYHTTDGGKSWVLQASGTTENLLALSFVDASHGWIVGENGTILHTSNGGDTAVEDPLNRETPQTYSLHQNYPNPFNPVTTIEFSLSRKSRISLRVYNLKGEEVATLSNGEYFPGIHKVSWRADHMTSGVYFYRLQADDFSETRKMILLR